MSADMNLTRLRIVAEIRSKLSQFSCISMMPEFEAFAKAVSISDYTAAETHYIALVKIVKIAGSVLMGQCLVSLRTMLLLAKKYLKSAPHSSHS
jgi:hypothetical protein